MRINDKKQGFLFHFDWADVLADLPENMQLSFLKAILAYAVHGEKPTDKIISALTATIRATIDRDTEAYNNKCEKNRQIAEARERMRRERMQTDVHERVRTSTYNDSDNDNDNDSDIIKDNNKDNNPLTPLKGGKAKKFFPPTVDEVNAYCQERKNNIVAQAFIDFYESKGWMVGSNKMKDWKAAVRTWEQRHKTENRRPAAGQSQSASVTIETDRIGNRIAVYPDGFRATLGCGEYIDKDGNRRYSENRMPVPREATPRPGNDYTFSRESGNWITGF